MIDEEAYISNVLRVRGGGRGDERVDLRSARDDVYEPGFCCEPFF